MVLSLHKKDIFSKSWNIMESSKRPSKYYLSIKFLAEKRSYFSSPKSLKQELFSNQYISSFHQLPGYEKNRISHLQQVPNKNSSVISKYNFSFNFLCKKDSIFHLWKVQNKNFWVISKYHIFIIFLARKKFVFSIS